MRAYRIKKKILTSVSSTGLGVLVSLLLTTINPEASMLTVAILGIVSSVLGFFLFGNDTSKDKITKGTHLISPKEFQKKINGNGLHIPCTINPPKLLKAFLPAQTINLAIRQDDETVHALVAGDSGTGKSALQHTFLYQIALRATERVVVYDPSLEFYKRHGNKARGDVLLYPMDDFCPYWNLGDEIRNRLDAAALAKSLIPDKREGVTDFWDQAPRQLLVRLLLKIKEDNLGHEMLVRWLADQEMIFDVVEETSAEFLIDKNAHGQRSGVLASLSRISDALELLPPNDGRKNFSFTDWSANSNGWLFIGTKGAGERDGLRPLISAWLDTAFARLMEHEGGTPTWIFVDELPSLQKLPSLKTALYEGRKYNMKFILGFQGRAQIEQLYQRDAETLMSMPDTRIFLRTKEFAAADWAAKNIGMPERERQLEAYTSPFSVSRRGGESVSIRTEKRTDYLVYPNEIQNLPKLTGFLRYDRFAVPIEFPYPTAPSQQTKPEQVKSGIRQLESAYATANQLYASLGVISLGLIGYCYKSIFIDETNPHPLVKVGLLGCLFTAIVSALAESQNSKNAKQGADGEEDIFELLTESLSSQGWRFQFNVMLADNWDVDIVAESPKGKTYIVDVKSHRGTKIVTNNGLTRRYGTREYPFKKCFLTKAKSQAATVKDRFGYAWVTPIVCFSDGQVEYLEERIDPLGVVVVSANDLVESLDILEAQDT